MYFLSVLKKENKIDVMAKNKTIETKDSVADFLKTITDEKRRKDCSAIIDLISQTYRT